MREEILRKLLADRESLKLENWNNDWIATYTKGNHTFHIKDTSLDNLLNDLLKWRKLDE